MNSDPRLPPYSEEAERGVLGSIMLDAARVLPLGAAAGLTADWFYVPAHQVVFAAVAALRPDWIDLLTTGDELKARGTLEKIGGHAFLERLIDATPTATHAEYYLRIVAEQYRRRQIISAAQQALADAASDTPLAAILDQQAEVYRQLAAQTAAGVRAVDASVMVQSAPPPAESIIVDLFDRGDKVPIIGSSKARKSFFALQMALSLAAGKESFLTWQIRSPRRVLLFQLEVKECHYHRRLFNMAQVMEITAAQLGDRLAVASLRGHAFDHSQLFAMARRHRAEVIIIDPLYKLATGDENLAADMKPLLAMFDRLAEETGAAVIYVHHNPKGTAGDREARDRGAGSGVIARDFDACIYLTEHADHSEDAEWHVVETLLRNYAPQKPFVAGWECGCFEVMDGIEPIVKTTASRMKKLKQGGQSKPEPPDDLVIGVAATVRTLMQFKEKLAALGFSQRGAAECRTRLTAAGTLEEYKPKVFPKQVLIATPEAIKRHTAKLENPELSEVAIS